MFILFADELSEHACAVYSERMETPVSWYFMMTFGTAVL